MNFPFFTFGGLFYRADKYTYGGWRIQKFLWTNRCRLLDPWHIRRASGSFDACKHRLEDFFKAWELPAPPKKAVVFLRGYFQTPFVFSAFEKNLSADYEIVHFSCPLTRQKPDEIVKGLSEYLAARPDIREINFVATGIGAELLRIALSKDDSLTKRLGRSVFIAAPSDGYKVFEKRKDNRFLRFLFGACFDLLVPSQDGKAIPPMSGDFAQIYGGRESERGFCPFLKGDNDGWIRVDEAQTPNAKESYFAADEWHYSVLRDKKTVDLACHFIRNGRLGSGRRIRKDPTITNLWDG